MTSLGAQSTSEKSVEQSRPQDKSSPTAVLDQTGKEFPSEPYTSPEYRRWLAAADKSGNIAARGYYDYAATCTMSKDPFSLPVSLVECTLRIQGQKIYGTTQDTTGFATIDGTFDPQQNAIFLSKKYYEVAPNHGPELPKWHYRGSITPCGIVGEWHYPGDPLHKAHWRGSFGFWLRDDEYAKGDQLVSQMKLLREKGRVLTRSMTGISRSAAKPVR